MIKPTKHLDLSYSVVKILSEMIKIMKKNSVLTYDELLEKIIFKIGEDAKYNFISALNILYIFDKIKYFPKSDSFEYIKKIVVKMDGSKNEIN